MPLRLRLFFSSLIAALLLIPALAVYRKLAQRSDIWWTPPPMALSLSQSRDRVQIYVRGKSLDSLLDAKLLSVTDDKASSTLTPPEVGLRFNNWDRVRAARLPVLL